MTHDDALTEEEKQLPAEDEVMNIAILRAVEKASDDELRARYRPLLALFYGSPPAWLQTFVDGGPLVLPEEKV